jgi:hypothetical protein
MPRISSFVWATTVIFTASTSVFGMPSRASSAPDISFSVFFDPSTAALSKEGREIISVAAKRFATTHSRHSAARVFITNETHDQQSASLSNERIKAVCKQLMRDGLQEKFVSAVLHPSGRAEPLSLQQWQGRRVSISIQENPVIARL